MHQENHYPGRVSGTDLVNPYFAALARAHGAHAETVERDEDVAGAIDRALGSGRLSLLHLRLDPRALSTSKDLQ
jgi:acetolactate synthase-1/2/3 large subunit